MSKKIMQINITCGVGSTGRIAKALYETSIKEGYRACFAYSAYKPLLKEAFRIETKMQNIVRRGANRIFGRRQRHSTSGTKRLIQYIKREKPDLIHIHNVQQNSVNYVMLFRFLKKEQIPIVFTLHDCWAFTGGCFHFSKIKCTQYKEGCCKCGVGYFDDVKISPRNSYLLKQKYIGNNEKIFVTCVSKWLSGEARKSYIGEMVHSPQVIYNGVNTNVFYPRRNICREEKLNIQKDAFVILGVASFWNEDKGIHMLLDVMKKLPERFKLVLIGAGLGEFANSFERNIICVERTESMDELAEYYSIADVFVNASIEETFGLTTAEALACGTPAIVFKSTACPEIIDEKTGISVEYDVNMLAKALCQIEKKHKNYYTEACVSRARELFDEEKMIDSYMDLYEKIMNCRQEKN